MSPPQLPPFDQVIGLIFAARCRQAAQHLRDPDAHALARRLSAYELEEIAHYMEAIVSREVRHE